MSWISNHALVALSSLWLSTFMGAVLFFLVQVLIARSLSPEAYGMFSSALAFVGILTPLVGFGISQYWLKEFSKEGATAVRIVAPSIKLIGLNFIIIYAALILWSLVGPHDKAFQTILLVAYIHVAGIVAMELIQGKLQLEERFRALAVWHFSGHFFRFILVILVIFMAGTAFSAQTAVFVYAFIAVFLVLLATPSLIRLMNGTVDLVTTSKNMPAPTQGKHSQKKEVLRNAWPFGVAALCHLIYFQSDIVLLKYLSGDAVAGVYNVAFTVLVAILLFPSIIYRKFLLPKVHRWAYTDFAKMHSVYKQGNKIMLIFGCMAAVCIWIFSPYAVPLIFGKEYSGAISLLNVLSISIPMLFIANSVGVVLETQEHMRSKVKMMGAVALVNICLNVLLIPHYSAYGAAIATVISNIALLCLYWFKARQIFQRQSI